ncbi:MAG TPA: TonB-dependent receptor plug domain-containing protein [Gemmatimonadaceae bacterium]|jgi:TonB-dependent SusC/RagA subfamily outer membrane receptor|nr:TonB-dependent receptor plug domain-containing protein [Gemmatimonadaceae bacterium]
MKSLSGRAFTFATLAAVAPVARPLYQPDPRDTSEVRQALPDMSLLRPSVLAGSDSLEKPGHPYVDIRRQNEITTLSADSINTLIGLAEGRDPLKRGVRWILETAARVRIRTDSTAANPVIIIDGVMVAAADSSWNQIDPKTIKTIEVIKGPSAIAIYGVRAIPGVIVLTTRRAKAP